MIREAAGHDAGRFREVMDYPLRELFLGYTARLREIARRNYELDVLVWAALAPHQKNPAKPPDVPALLRR